MTVRPCIVTGISGLSSVDYVEDLIARGASEFFAGYVPPAWYRRYGFEVSPNRRYLPESQFLSRKALEKMAARIHARGARITLTLNEHAYSTPQVPLLQQIVEQGGSAGVDGYIVADPAIITLLRQWRPEAEIILSGEAGVYNRQALRFFKELGVSRVILPRELSLQDIASLAKAGPGLPLEAFIFGDFCRYNAAFCFTGHAYDRKGEFCYQQAGLSRVCRHTGESTPGAGLPQQNVRQGHDPYPSYLARCGLCALGALMDSGVTHLKVPGRGKDVARMISKVQRLLESADRGPERCREILGAPAYCESGQHCHYSPW